MNLAQLEKQALQVNKKLKAINLHRQSSKNELFNIYDSLGNVVAIKSITPIVNYTTNRKDKNGKLLNDGIEVRFGGLIPKPEVTNMLKGAGFKFSHNQQMWYAYDTPDNRSFAEEFKTMEVEAFEVEGEKNWFWAKLSSDGAYKKVPATAPLKVNDGGKVFTYKNKSELEAAKGYGRVTNLISSGSLYFKKFFTTKAGEASDGEGEGKGESGEPQNTLLPKTNKPVIQSTVAEGLRAKADAMEKRVQHYINPPIGQQRPTRRRQGIAASMRQTGYALEKTQHALFALAFAWDNGLLNIYNLLSGFRSGSEIELLYYFPNLLKTRATSNSDWDDLAKVGISNKEDWETALKQLTELVQEWQKNGSPRKYTNSLNLIHAPVTNNRALEEEIKAMERDLLGRKIPGFFPTPPELIAKMIKMADLQPTDNVLEPSCGKGDILEAIVKSNKLNIRADDNIKHLISSYSAFGSLTGIEFNNELVSICDKKARLNTKSGKIPYVWKVYQGDFLDVTQQWSNNNERRWEKILMNPPFEKGADIDHVLRAYNDFLKPGGKLVAIMGAGSFQRSYKKEKEFQEFINANARIGNATFEPISNAFNTKSSFVQTGVNVYLVTIDKPINAGSNTAKPTMQPTKTTATQTNDMELLELEAEGELMLIDLELEVLKLNKTKPVRL